MKLKYQFTVLFIFCFGNLIIAQELLTPLDVARVKYVNRVEISDDGQYIAYTISNPADPLEKNESAQSHLYVYDVENNRSIPFFTQSSVGSIAFRPGKGTLTFLTKRSGDKGRSLYEIGVSGGEAMKLYEHNTSISHYEWSDDGSKLAVIANEEKESKESKLPYQPEIYEEDLTYTRIFLVNPANWTAEEVPVTGDVKSMKWSPDGSRMAVSAAPTPLVDDYYMKQGIHIYDANSNSKIGEVDHLAKLGQFEWSPDGKQLGIIAGAHINDPIDGRLLLVGANGGKPTNLFPDFKGKFESISWKDEETITYLVSKSVYSGFGTIDIDKQSMNPLVEESLPILKGFSQAGNGSTAFMAESPNHPPELYYMGKKDKVPERLTNNNAWLAAINMGKQEVIRYPARDGMEIEGILIRPVNERTGEEYPLITVVHGGPEAHYDNGWLTRYSSPGQMAAGRGYAVFYPNYRGSTGRGLEFAMSSQADLAGKEFDDIVDGVDYLIESGLVDEDKVGVTGGSYGGYATGWMATKYSDRFAAGVMFVGISNNLSKWGTSDIPEELYHVHARKRVWDDYDFFRERSPIYHVDNAKTPLLIMHGKEDPRVYPGQSMELYRHIKTRTDTPVRLVFYPGEGHGNRKSTARFDYNVRMMRWFNNYLKGEEEDLGTKIDLPESK